MKKALLLLTVLALVAFASSAFAYGGRHHGRGPGQDYGQGGPGYSQGGPGGWNGPCGGPGGPRHFRNGDRGPRGWNIEVPQNIRDKQVEAQKLMIDLRAEMSKNQVDKSKAMDLYRKHRALRNEISEWFFTQRLENIGKAPVPATPLQPATPSQTQ